MHELSVCQSMLKQIETIAMDNQAATVSKVFVQIGPLSGIEPELLSQAFPIATAGSIADGAELHIETLPVIVHCQTCGSKTAARVNNLVCKKCGDWHTKVISGDEMLLASVELNK